MREIISLVVFTTVFATTVAAKPDANSNDSDAHAQTALSLRLSSQVLSDDADLTIFVSIEPDAHNTALVVEADGGPLFTSSEISLEGAAEKRVHSLTFRRLVSGRYDITARLYAGDRVRATTHKQLIVGTDAIVEGN